MKKLSALFLFVIASFTGLFAFTPPDEGMWLPMLVDRLNFVDMQKMGLHLTADELYNINHSSLKDGVVGLASGSAPNGYFCTAEVVSDEGLILTNHHCGFDAVQQKSNLQHDYLTEGFWAMTREEELPADGVTASFLIRMENVTEKVLGKISDTLSDAERSAEIKKITTKLKKEASEDGKYDVAVKSFFNGNEYYMFVYQTFKDLRLVGAPPSSIGKFGGDTDNWMWPRQTGDFSMMRIYTAPDGTPSEYSKNNVPLKPKYRLPISLKGIKKDDFTMIWGYPGSTDRFLSSYGVSLKVEKTNPALIRIFGKELETWKEDMDASQDVKIKYASKYAQIANAWKNFIGEDRGVKRLNVIDKRKELEARFQQWADADQLRREKYGKVLENMGKSYAAIEQSVVPLYYVNLAVMGGPEILQIAREFAQLYTLLESGTKGKEDAIKETVADLRESAKEHFKNYNAPTDQKMLAVLFGIYCQDIPAGQRPPAINEIFKKYNGDFSRYAAELFKKSFFNNEASVNKFLDNPKFKTLKKDPAFSLANSVSDFFMTIVGKYREAMGGLGQSERLFVKGLMEMDPSRKFYPDANSTMRMTYGRVLDYYPADAVHYDYVTHLDGVMEKEDPSNEEFIVPQKLKELYKNKDYGQYGENGKMITCFLTNNDITGGNSGSPVLNGNGELIGIAFDGNWEAMSGDIEFEPDLQRTICVDIRYVLFVVDKYAGASHLIREMTLLK